MNVENIKKFQVDLGNLQAYIVREMVTIKEFEDMHPQLFSPITTRPRTTLPDTTNFKIQGIRVVQGGFASTNLRADILCQSNQPGGHDTQLVSLPVSGDMAEDYANTVRNWFNETTDSIATFVTVEPDGFSSKASVAGTLPVGSGPGSVEVSLVTSGPEFSIHPSLIQTVTAPAPTVRMDLSNYAATLSSLHHLSGNHQPTGRVFLSGTVGECSDPLIIDARFEHPYTDHVILVVLLGFTVLFVQQVDLDRYKLFVPAHAAKSFGQSTMEFDHRVLAELDTRAGRQLGHYTISLADLERHEGGLRPVLNWRGKNIPGANLDFQKTQAWVNDDRSNRTMFYAQRRLPSLLHHVFWPVLWQQALLHHGGVQGHADPNLPDLPAC